MFKYSVTTKKSLEEAVSALESSLKEQKFGVLWNLDVRKQLHSKGIETDVEFHILEVCNSAKAKEVLETNILVGYFLPCKIVVYKTKGETTSGAGQTTIGMIRPTTIVNFLEDASLNEFAKEVENILITAIDSAAV